MPRKFTFKECRAHIDFADDWPKLKALIDRAYPDPY